MNSMRCLRAKHRRPYPIYNRPMRISNMSPRTLSTLALAAFSAAALSAATDPFVGTWRLNPAKSKFSGEQIKIDDLGQNRYKIIGGVDSDTITADGTDQPVHYGRTEAITKQGANVWKIVVKKDGKVLSTGTWTLSGDGQTLARSEEHTSELQSLR